TIGGGEAGGALVQRRDPMGGGLGNAKLGVRGARGKGVERPRAAPSGLYFVQIATVPHVAPYERSSTGVVAGPRYISMPRREPGGMLLTSKLSETSVPSTNTAAVVHLLALARGGGGSGEPDAPTTGPPTTPPLPTR